MGKGEELGLQIRAWQEAGVLDLDHPTALANRLNDALGAEEWLRGPVRDLASQPLLRQLLLARGSQRRSALHSLALQLESTYAPRVLHELLALLQAASGLELDRPDPPEASGWLPAAESPRQEVPSPPPPPTDWPEQLRLLGPGAALAALAALVWCWGAGELDRWLFEPWGWSGGVVLVVVLGLLQALALGPLRRLRRDWPLEQADATDPHQAWRWITAPWIHHANGEALLNLLLLLLLLGPSPLPLADVVLRYCLTGLATAALALLVAQRRTGEGRWDGASGAVAALLALGGGASLLHWRSLAYPLGPIAIPAWVLLVVVGCLQLNWQLPRRSPHDGSRPIDRLLSSQWWWGTVLGAGWAVVSRLVDLVEGLRPAGG
ncbi:MAG: rhomboid family intramembrane serine protease [Synechococcus sp.]